MSQLDETTIPYIGNIKGPPYRRNHAHRILADFEYVVREHELVLTKPLEERQGIKDRYLEEKAKMIRRLTQERT